MSTYGIIRQFKTKNFTVIVDALPEDSLDLSWDDTGEVADKLDDGEYVAFCARVRVLYHGMELSSDYLGECIYFDISEFQNHRACGRQNREYAAQGKAGRCGSYFSGMIHQAIREARVYFSNMRNAKLRA